MNLTIGDTQGKTLLTVGLSLDDLYSFAHATRRAIKQVEWYLCTYLFAQDGSGTHLIEKEQYPKEPSTQEQRNAVRSLCGKQASNLYNTLVKEWHITPSLLTYEEMYGAGICQRCQGVVQQREQERKEREKQNA